ncbi:MAG: 30S ribosomal protein S20 [Puniceicoccales bacterium]|jgi:small subunit ribosomal protein S20|nr:30S ribosomal protein S20 [Puniceicoccales bacterium]
MANIKSSQKDIRKTATRTAANTASRSRLKTLSKNAAAALKGGDEKKIADASALTASAYDKAVKTGVVHKNKANRVKAKLAKAAVKAKAATPAKAA